jgi:hypothetical protein
VCVGTSVTGSGLVTCTSLVPAHLPGYRMPPRFTPSVSETLQVDGSSQDSTFDLTIPLNSDTAHDRLTLTSALCQTSGMIVPVHRCPWSCASHSPDVPMLHIQQQPMIIVPCCALLILGPTLMYLVLAFTHSATGDESLPTRCGEVQPPQDVMLACATR